MAMGTEGTGHRNQQVVIEAAAEVLPGGRAETPRWNEGWSGGQPVTQSPGEKAGPRDASAWSQGTNDGSED